MDERRPARPDDEMLPDRAVARLLERASELDALRRDGATVSELRAAAAEAGISAQAFDAALAEMHAGRQVAAPVAARQAPSRARRLVLATLLAALAAGASLTLTQRGERADARASSATPMTEQSFLLRCLPANEAAALVRPLLPLPENQALVFSVQTGRVLTVHASAEQLREVRALLDRYDGAGSAACARVPGAPSTP